MSTEDKLRQSLEQDKRPRVVLEHVLVDGPGTLEEKLDRREEQYNRVKKSYEPAFDRDMERLVLMGYARPGHPQKEDLPQRPMDAISLRHQTYDPGPRLGEQPTYENVHDLWPQAIKKIASEDFGNMHRVYGVPYVSSQYKSKPGLFRRVRDWFR